MRFTKTAFVALFLAVAAALSSHNGSAAGPAITASGKLPEFIDQKLHASDSIAMRGKQRGDKTSAANKVIALLPPKEYVDWLSSKTGLMPFDGLHVEAVPTTHGVWFIESGAAGLTEKSGNVVDHAWSISVLESSNDGPDNDGKYAVAGVIQVDVSPDHRYCLPFHGQVNTGEKRLDSEIQIPKDATITWSKPECLKREE
jgi:hypothetical protein